MPDELKLEDIITKEAGDLTKEEIAHLEEQQSQLTDDQLEKFKSVLEEKKEGGDNGDGDGNGDKKD